MSIFKPFIVGISGLILAVGSWFGLVPSQVPVTPPVTTEAAKLGAYNVTGGTTYHLRSSISSTDSTLNLSSFEEPVSDIPYTMAYLNTSVAYGTIDPQTSRSEFVSFTGITQNSNGSATLTGVSRGLTRTPAGTSCTASTTLALRHPGQAIFILSDSPCHFAEYAVKRNDETVSGAWTFPEPTAAANPATKNYVDNIALSGNTTVDKLVVAGTAGETVSAGQVLYLNRFDGLWYKANANVASTTVYGVLGIAQGAGTASVSISGGVLVEGLDTHQLGMTAGRILYVSGTSGATSTTPGTFARIIGQARTATNLYVNPMPNTLTAYFATTTAATSTVSSLTVLATSTLATTTINSLVVSDVGKNKQICTANCTWTKATGVTTIKVVVIGGGGGGGGASSSAGGGGGGGAACIAWIDVTATSTVNVKVGGGGSAGSSGGAGGTGGSSVFSSYCTANGGPGGAATAEQPSVAATASGGDINIPGDNGSPGLIGTGIAIGGQGGSSILAGRTGVTADGNTGDAGQLYGGGGGGSTQTASTRVGSAGAAGIVIITW